MSEERVERRLAAILAADVAGYSRLMGQDEAGTLARLNTLRRELINPKVAEHKGRIVKTNGDGLLIEFPSVVEAVACAVALQRSMSERNGPIPQGQRIEFRVGINSGDVIVEDGDIHGDGVNIAARLEGIAEPGGICVSAIVHDQVQGRVDCAFGDIGEQYLKNIARPVRVYRVALTRLAPAALGTLSRNAGEGNVGASLPLSRIAGEGGGGRSPTPGEGTSAPLPLPDKPSIAVLPFQNMSGDPEQEYFADGMVEEIITALSRIRWLFVIARNSTFTFKGKAVDVKQVGRELGVRYVLEGSVRKAADRVRITGQLIDAGSGAHLWADRFDGTLEDIFDLQDQVTTSVVGAIAPTVEQAEIGRAKRKPTESLDAYDMYLRGIAGLHAVFEGNRDAVSEALRLFYRAIELDPGFAAPCGMAAWCYVLHKNYGWTSDDTQETAEIERLARQAARLARDDTVALYTGGFALARIVGQLNAGAALIDRALTLDPSLAAAWHLSGWVRIYLGEPDLAVEHMARAMRLNPLDPIIFGMQNGTAAAHFLAARYDEAADWAETALQLHSSYAPGLRMAAASHAMAGRLAEAQRFIVELRRVEPGLRLASIGDLAPFRRPDDIARYAKALRLAGMPD